MFVKVFLARSWSFLLPLPLSPSLRLLLAVSVFVSLCLWSYCYPARLASDCVRASVVLSLSCSPRTVLPSHRCVRISWSCRDVTHRCFLFSLFLRLLYSWDSVFSKIGLALDLGPCRPTKSLCIPFYTWLWMYSLALVHCYTVVRVDGCCFGVLLLVSLVVWQCTRCLLVYASSLCLRVVTMTPPEPSMHEA